MITTTLPGFAGTINVPTSAHQHVREQNQIAGKINKQPLAAGFHFFDGSSDNAFVNIHARKMRQHGFEGSNVLSRQRQIQSTRRAKMVSPSGISSGFLNVRGIFVFDFRFALCGEQRRFGAAHLVAQHGIHETGVHQMRGQQVFTRGRVIYFADQQTLPASLAANGDFRKFFGEFARKLAALRFGLGKKNAQGGIAPPQKRRQLSID